jgi:hypothetical protein
VSLIGTGHAADGPAPPRPRDDHRRANRRTTASASPAPLKTKGAPGPAAPRLLHTTATEESP